MVSGCGGIRSTRAGESQPPGFAVGSLRERKFERLREASRIVPSFRSGDSRRTLRRIFSLLGEWTFPHHDGDGQRKRETIAGRSAARISFAGESCALARGALDRQPAFLEAAE